MTSGLTKQASSVQLAADKLKAKKVTIYGVSTDDAATQKKFAEKEKLI